LGRNVITENMTIVNCMVSGFEVGTLIRRHDEAESKWQWQRTAQVRPPRPMADSGM